MLDEKINSIYHRVLNRTFAAEFLERLYLLFMQDGLTVNYLRQIITTIVYM